jgi:hypothetical protein
VDYNVVQFGGELPASMKGKANGSSILDPQNNESFFFSFKRTRALGVPLLAWSCVIRKWLAVSDQNGISHSIRHRCTGSQLIYVFLFEKKKKKKK